MKVLFLGLLYPKEEEKAIHSKSSCGLQSAANTYQWELINGFDAILDSRIKLLTSIPVGTYPRRYKDLFIPSRNWSHIDKVQDKEIGYINLPILKQIIRFYQCHKEINQWCKKNRAEELTLISYSLYLPYLMLLKAIKKKHKNLCICLIVPDLPNRHGYRPSGTVFKNMLYRLSEMLQYQYSKAADAYVLLTGNMVVPLGIKEKPYVIIEGICSLQPLQPEITEVPDNIISFFYSGALNRGFGIDKLILAFQSIPGDYYRLWICGAGDYRKEIEIAAVKDPRIIYFGYLPRDEILEMQRKATILINPRANDQDYTKYSFPSKTMEYMASTRPVLMFRLDGIPEEYDDYLYYIKENTVEGIAQAMLETSSMPMEELEKHGKEAREFVIKNKNNKIQAGKILDILKLTAYKRKSGVRKQIPCVLHINITCQFGSTGRVVEAIHNHLMDKGFQSHIAYSAYHSKLKNSFKIESLFENYLRRALNRFFGRKYAHSAPGTLRLIKNIKKLHPDIIHLHNIQQNSVHFPMLLDFLKEQDIPVVYTLNDCWPFTGGCYHFTHTGCNGYQTGCLQCPLDIKQRDICNKPANTIYHEKDKALHALNNLQLVCVSNWQKSCAQQSFMKDLPLQVVYNGVDTNLFKPLNYNMRMELGLTEEEFIILGVASFWTKEKGLDIFIELSKVLGTRSLIVLVGELSVSVPENIISLPRTDDIHELVRLYNSADVFFNASKEEAFGLTAVEAMACGTPVIAFNSTACGEVVSQETGIVLDSFEIKDLLHAMEQIKGNGKKKYSENCVIRVKNLFTRETMLENYLSIYEKLLSIEQ